MTRRHVHEEEFAATLRVVQDGFPDGAAADTFYAACDSGWRTTFAGIRRHLEGGDAPRHDS